MLQLLFYKQLLQLPVENGSLGEELEGQSMWFRREMVIASDIARVRVEQAAKDIEEGFKIYWRGVKKS